jgi:hypothetical protein
MTAHPPRTGAGLAGYLEAMDADGAPLLGHMVLYSVFDSRGRRGQSQRATGFPGHCAADQLPPCRLRTSDNPCRLPRDRAQIMHFWGRVPHDSFPGFLALS